MPSFRFSSKFEDNTIHKVKFIYASSSFYYMKQIINLILTVLLTITSLLSVGLLWRQNLLLFLVLIVLAALLLVMNRSKKEIKTFFFCGFFGPMAEVFVITFGTWSYANPSMMGIPIWLFILWGIASIFMVRGCSFFKD